MGVSGVIEPLLLGVATGCRASTGLAGVAYGDRVRGEPRVIGALQSRAGRVSAGVLVVAELVGDKQPAAPSRLSTQALIPRLVMGATGGAALAWRDGNSRRVAAVAGLAGAVVGSVGGLRFRQAVKHRGLPDLPAALAEDAVALALARTAGRARGR